MAFEMNYTLRGIPSSKSYWKVAQTNLNHVNKTGNITFNGYIDKTARDANSDYNVMEQRPYEVTPEQYDTYFSQPNDVRAQAYLLAKSAPEGESPIGGKQDKRVSFFATAVDA